MNYRLMGSYEHFKHYNRARYGKYKTIGLIGLLFIITRTNTEYMRFSNDVLNQLIGFLILGSLIVGVTALANNLADRVKLEKNFIEVEPGMLTYHFVYSGGYEGVRIRPYRYYTYQVSNINNIIEKSYCYVIYGDVKRFDDRLTSNIKRLDKIVIPKYFEQLDEVMAQLK